MVRNSTITNNVKMDCGWRYWRHHPRYAINDYGKWRRMERWTGGVVLSYADNNIDGNGSANTEPPGPSYIT